MKSRKLLVPFDMDKPDRKINGFLCPIVNSDGTFTLTELNSGKTWDAGMVILKGGGIDTNDLFKEVVDLGVKIPSVDNLLNSLEDYIIQIKEFKIGNIVGIESSENGFELIKLEKPKSKTKCKLP